MARHVARIIDFDEHVGRLSAVFTPIDNGLNQVWAEIRTLQRHDDRFVVQSHESLLDGN